MTLEYPLYRRLGQLPAPYLLTRGFPHWHCKPKIGKYALCCNPRPSRKSEPSSPSPGRTARRPISPWKRCEERVPARLAAASRTFSAGSSGRTSPIPRRALISQAGKRLAAMEYNHAGLTDIAPGSIPSLICCDLDRPPSQAPQGFSSSPERALVMMNFSS